MWRIKSNVFCIQRNELKWYIITTGKKGNKWQRVWWWALKEVGYIIIRWLWKWLSVFRWIGDKGSFISWSIGYDLIYERC